MNSISGLKIILPPLLRFVSGGCCGESSHARNVGSEGHGDDFLKKIVHLRKVVKTELTGSSLTGYWVADPVGYLLDSDLLHPATTAALTHFFGGDNVHFTLLGYTKLVGGLSSAFGNAVKNVRSSATFTSVSGTGRTAGRFYWRGFMSQHGAARENFKYCNSKTGHHSTKLARNHPYRGAH